MLSLLTVFVLLSAVIVVAAMQLAKFGDEIADKTGLGGSVTGLVLLAGATSLPELSVGYSAIQLGAPDLTAGGVLGSSMVNLLILALIDLISRNPGRIFTRTSAAHALSATVGALLTTIVLLGLLQETDWTFLRIGPFSLAILVAYGFCTRLLFRDQRESAKHAAAEIPAERLGEASPASRPLALSILGFIVATTVIFFVAPVLAERADKIAEITGLGRTFIGTLLLALVTSLPEAVSTVAAIRLGAVDMAVANIFGSNAFNMTIFGVLDVASPSPIMTLVSPTHAITAACVLICTCIAILAMLSRAEKRWWIIEPDAALIAILVVGGMYLVYLNG